MLASLSLGMLVKTSALLMKRFELLLFVLFGFLALSSSAQAQSGRVKEAAATALTDDANKPSEAKPADLNDSRTAAQLFEDADN